MDTKITLTAPTLAHIASLITPQSLTDREALADSKARAWSETINCGVIFRQWKPVARAKFIMAICPDTGLSDEDL